MSADARHGRKDGPLRANVRGKRGLLHLWPVGLAIEVVSARDTEKEDDMGNPRHVENFRTILKKSKGGGIMHEVDNPGSRHTRSFRLVAGGNS